MEAKKQDLRVQKTLAAIRAVFEEMVCTMPPQEITVKELTERAKINRKTFYLHYTCIEDVYEEAISRIAAGYLEVMGGTEIDNGRGAFDMRNLTRVFFEYYSSQGAFAERLICNPDYRQYFNRLCGITLRHNCGRFNPYANLPQEEQNLIFTFLCTASNEMYSRWVMDGKKVPPERVIAMASQLLEHGLYGFTEKIADGADSLLT